MWRAYDLDGPGADAVAAMPLTRDDLDHICGALPGAELPAPDSGEHDAWKVGGKMFTHVFGQVPGFAVKTDSVETADMLISVDVAQKAPYFHRSWVMLPWSADIEEARHRIEASYHLVRAGLPKKVQASLGG